MRPKRPLNEALDAIGKAKAEWTVIVGEDVVDDFIEGVKQVVRIFYDLTPKKELADQIKTLEKACRKHPEAVPDLVETLPEYVKTHLEFPQSPLSSRPPDDDKKALQEFVKDIHSRVVVNFQWIIEGDKRRRIFTPIVKLGKGRPRQHTVDVLVSFLASTYARNTGKAITRNWSLEEEESNFEIIVGDVFICLNLSANAEYAVKRHLTAINSLS